MYSDPSHIRLHPVKVSLSVYEHDLAAAAARYLRKPLAAFIREVVMEEVERALVAEQSASAEPEKRRTAG